MTLCLAFTNSFTLINAIKQLKLTAFPNICSRRSLNNPSYKVIGIRAKCEYVRINVIIKNLCTLEKWTREVRRDNWHVYILGYNDNVAGKLPYFNSNYTLTNASEILLNKKLSFNGLERVTEKNKLIHEQVPIANYPANFWIPGTISNRMVINITKSLNNKFPDLVIMLEPSQCVFNEAYYRSVPLIGFVKNSLSLSKMSVLFTGINWENGAIRSFYLALIKQLLDCPSLLGLNEVK